MKKIFLTVDIECHDINRKNQYIEGKCKDGYAGLEYILTISREYHIPVNFFLDIPELNKYGKDFIIEIIDLIKKYNQPIFLHLHPKFISNQWNKDFLWFYSYGEKKDILKQGFELYKEYIGKDADCFRIGCYGADIEMYEALEELGISVMDLSYCYENPKMCHITYNEIRTKNKVIKKYNQIIFPNTRVLSFKFLGIKKYINVDASEMSLGEFIEFLDKTQLENISLTMHSWHFIDKYFFLKKYVGLNQLEVRKFKKMVEAAFKRGFEFGNLELDFDNKLNIDNKDEGDEVIDLTSSKLKMLARNFVRYQKIGKLNKKYFAIYLCFYFSIVVLINRILYFLPKGDTNEK